MNLGRPVLGIHSMVAGAGPRLSQEFVHRGWVIAFLLWVFVFCCVLSGLPSCPAAVLLSALFLPLLFSLV